MEGVGTRIFGDCQYEKVVGCGSNYWTNTLIFSLKLYYLEREYIYLPSLCSSLVCLTSKSFLCPTFQIVLSVSDYPWPTNSIQLPPLAVLSNHLLQLQVGLLHLHLEVFYPWVVGQVVHELHYGNNNLVAGPFPSSPNCQLSCATPVLLHHSTSSWVQHNLSFTTVVVFILHDRSDTKKLFCCLLYALIYSNWQLWFHGILIKFLLSDNWS